GHGDGQPAHRRGGSARAVWRTQGFKLWSARAGPLRGGVLHHGQDRLYIGLKATAATPAGGHARPAATLGRGSGNTTNRSGGSDEEVRVRVAGAGRHGTGRLF